MLRLSTVVLCNLLILIFTINFTYGASVMSIDLGSEWMKIAVVSPGVPMEIVLNKESKRKTPSVISFRDNTRVFGEDAQTLGVRFPANSFAYLLDLIGKTIDNPMVELYRKRFPYYDIVEDADRRTIVFKSGDETYSIEELIAQMLQKAKEFAQDSTGQPISECVIIVPGYFGQAERAALFSAGRLANLKILQLINDYTAVGLNYGIFRRKEINETAQYFIFYDMGASKTTASVISYQLIKDKTTLEKLPVVEVLGVGYDRTLGGLEMQIRLRDYLGKKFNEMKKTKTDVFTNPRAMAKLFKEAGRLKNVLSANTEHHAQIEGLLDEQDFRLMVTRDEFEKLCSDLFDRVAVPLEKALSASGLALENINQVILFGGGTRVPKVQEVLKNLIQQDLGKNLNADEAACMGAVYRAADLTTGFKVKKVLIKDAVLFPLEVVFEREGDSGKKRRVRRTLFNHMNTYPQKKVITFNKNVDDFTFDVNYAELDFLYNKDEIQRLGSLNLTKIKLTEVAKKFEIVKENCESKGIKVHFALDDSGILNLANVELVVEKTVTKEDEDENESTLSKLGNTITNLFGGGSSDKDKDKEKENEETDESKKESESENSSSEQQATNDTKTVNETSSGDNEAAKNKTEKPKIVTIKEKIPSDVTVVYVTPLDGDAFDKSVDKLKALEKSEAEIVRKQTALNALESFVIDASTKIDEDEYKECATSEEVENIKKACNEVSEWLYEDGIDADAQTYENKLNELQTLTNEVYAKHWEHNERPEALKALKSMINGSEMFYNSAKNLTKDQNPEKDVFKQTEIDNLEKVIKETKQWRDTEIEEQNKLSKNEPVRLTVKAITDKMALLDREVKYLVNKLKSWKPKVKPTPPPKPEKDNKTQENETKTDEQQNTEETIEVQEEKPDANENNDDNQSEQVDDDSDNILPTKPLDADQVAENHSEL
uniref:Hypoxia up-regulated protein 1 n=1 Tax=Corethrella appendiculata TaxID=1370023 RepID=U5EW42_9DIPT